MSKTYVFGSWVIIGLTIIWLVYEFSLRHFVKWHWLTAGGLHFIAAIIINRQFTQLDTNWLGGIHIICAAVFFGLGYFLL